MLGRDVTLFDAVTGRETDLGTTVSAKDSEGYAVHALAWSPDGTRIAYDGPEGTVYSIDVESGEHPLLSTGPREWRRSKISTGRRMARTWHHVQTPQGD